MNYIKRQCDNCNKTFSAPVREVNRGNGRFCNISCGAKHSLNKRWSKNKPNVECAHCNKMFYKSKSKQALSKSGLFFCCREHKDAAQRIGGIKEIMPPHYGNGNGTHQYRENALNHYSNICTRCGYDKFIQALIVHHKDENRSNNKLKNLEIVCRNCHTLIHRGII